MLTVMCPNCRHRFRAARCCEPGGGGSGEGGGTTTTSCSQREDEMLDEEARVVNDFSATTTATTTTAAATVPTTAACYVGGLLVPHGYTSGDGTFINAPTIVHGPAVFQSGMTHCAPTVEIVNHDATTTMTDHTPRLAGAIPRSTQTFARQSPCHATSSTLLHSSRMSPLNEPHSPVIVDYGVATPATEQHVATKCELSDNTVTISTPGIQSGGYLIQSTENGILVQAPKASIEIRPKLNDGSCHLQDRSAEDERLTASRYNTEANNIHRTFVAPPSGCSELPGCRRTTPLSRITRTENDETMEFRERKIPSSIRTNSCCCSTANSDGGTIQKHCQCYGQFESSPTENNHDSLLVEPVGGGGVQIQVNATLQLPACLGQCKVNITATTAALPTSNRMTATESRIRNNFNGGGIVQSDEIVSNNERNDGTPTTPVSWLMPYPWNLDTYLIDKDINRLCEVKRRLQMCGWYHEGISWQQSENLLKYAPVGCWLMRDSSDSRYTFAVSVQTNRGPTSVRVHYFLERFRLDAEPRLVLAMPLFDCPIKMLEHYVEYSKKMDEHRREVWVDYSGQLYSQIYLTKPLVKEVRSLSHLARLAVHRNKLPIDNLPLSIKNYLAEYPYTL